MTSAPSVVRVDPGLRLRFVDGQCPAVGELTADGPLVVFFFPAAFSPGCVAQACAFRDLAAEFAAVGASCVGVSADSARRLEAFGRTFRLRLPLVADRTGAVAAAFGVTPRRPARFLRREAVVLVDDGLVAARVSGLRDLEGYAQAALTALAGLER